jgi:site-specific DNA-adenine methylase
MLNHVLALIKTNEPENISLAYQLLQGNDSLKSDFNDWFLMGLRGVSFLFCHPPYNESDFVKIFQTVKMKYNYEIKYNNEFLKLCRSLLEPYDYKGHFVQP